MVLCAGLGTRLRPLTDRLAKPLVPVGDRPALAHILDHLRAQGVVRAVVNAHHLASQVIAFAEGYPGDGFEVRVSVETELLGTAGGLAGAAGLLGRGDVLVWNGDILAELDVPAIVDAHDARDAGECAATLVVQPLGPGEGAVGLDGQGRVVRLRQERFGDETRGAHFLGIYVLGAGLREHLVAPGGMIEHVLVPAMARGETLRAFETTSPWVDIGTVEAYLAANMAWLKKRRTPSWVAPTARVAPAVRLEGSVVGEGAIVDGEGDLLGCVVWPRARAEAPLRDQVVTSAA
jgi:mannose-1-phosphate guanylyltransferase